MASATITTTVTTTTPAATMAAIVPPRTQLEPSLMAALASPPSSTPSSPPFPSSSIPMTTTIPPSTPPPSSPRSSSTISSPPFWHSTTTTPTSTTASRRKPAHARSPSVDSTSSSICQPGRITLRDNEALDLPRSEACWARSVSVTDFVVIDGGSISIPGLPGSASGIKALNKGINMRLPGAFVSWNIRVETLTGGIMTISKRYSEFDEFRSKLVRTFPGFDGTIPELPPKSVIAKFRPKFLEKRRAGLQYFLNCILLNPEFSGSPVLKEFLFS